VPPGHELHHVDGNKANWNLDNLMALERKAHQELHRQNRSTDIYDKQIYTINREARRRRA
jgi:HNH endonuclease